MKMIGGKISYLIPKPIAIITFISSLNPVFGKFARMQPKAIGERSSGSYSLTNAMYRSRQPTTIMMILPLVIAEKPESFHTDWSETLNAVINSFMPIIPP